MSLFQAKRRPDVPEIDVRGNQATIATVVDVPELDLGERQQEEKPPQKPSQKPSPKNVDIPDHTWGSH